MHAAGGGGGDTSNLLLQLRDTTQQSGQCCLEIKYVQVGRTKLWGFISPSSKPECVLYQVPDRRDYLASQKSSFHLDGDI